MQNQKAPRMAGVELSVSMVVEGSSFMFMVMEIGSTNVNINAFLEYYDLMNVNVWHPNRPELRKIITPYALEQLVFSGAKIVEFNVG